MDLRKLAAFGTGAGIEISGEDLVVLVTRVRPSRIEVMGNLVIEGFRHRPAAEWGAEYSAFLKGLGVSYLSATVVLPRTDVIVRLVALPGVKDQDVPSAIAFQIESLHPWGDEEPAYAWQRVGPNHVLAGLVRRSVLDRYLSLFAEAGIALASFTFSAGAVHAAIRLYAPPGSGFVTFRDGDGEVEIYGESVSRPVFAATLDLPRERALALARAELRLDPEEPPRILPDILPMPALVGDQELSRSTTPYAASLAGACPRLAPAANLLPDANRVSSARGRYIPTAILAVVLAVIGGGVLASSAYADRRYLGVIQTEISRWEPEARRAAEAERKLQEAKQRVALLDDFRAQTRVDLDTLLEVTHLLEPPVWANNVQISPDSVTIAGEADQAAPLLQKFDASPFFTQSTFTVSLARTGDAELFRIRTRRETAKPAVSSNSATESGRPPTAAPAPPPSRRAASSLAVPLPPPGTTRR